MPPKGRRGSRRLLLQALYQFQISCDSLDQLIEQFSSKPQYLQVSKSYFKELLIVIIEQIDLLDGDIDACGDIDKSKLDPIERAILWIAMAEFRFRPDVPEKVVINEAIELAKEFGAEGSYRYVNGLLDKHIALKDKN
ncbi:MAG: transcription antitermination factor NusB [Pseudomonadota bacterium]|nr:transcription antitermination factor NusB [Pseudomonadota bacterium]